MIVNEDTDIAEVIKCTLQNPTLNKRSNKWEYQLVDEDGTFLDGGKFFEEGSFASFVGDPRRKAAA